MWKLLALPPLPEDAIRGLLTGVADQVEITVPPTRDRAGLLAALPDAELVVGDWSGLLALDAEAVQHAPRLAFVQQPSVGVNGHDLDALAKAGVPLANTAGANAQAVAEWCVAAAFALLRRLVAADAAVRAGEWPQLTIHPRELAGSRVGVIGLGPIGAACARLFDALGCPVSYWSRSRKQVPYAYQELDDLIAGSDVLVVVVPLTDETRGLLDSVRIASMPSGSLLIDAARGGIVDERALIAALESGHLAGAALDVYATEPPPPDDPVRSCEGILLSPHAAAVTPQATTRLIGCVVDNVASAVSGRPVANVVNGADPLIRRRLDG